MATILLAWECGGGYGHLTSYRNLIDDLHDQGHETYFAVRNLRAASRVYPDQKVGLFPAPQVPKNSKSHNKVMQPKSYLDVLVNQCFDHQESLQTRIRAWLSIFRSVDPRLIIVNHSPTALMAYKVFSQSECIVSGSAFCVPPSREGILPFSQKSGLTSADLRMEDKRLVEEFLNPCLANFNGPELDSCMDIFDPPQQIFGIPELDHYAEADRASLFIGHQKSNGGKDAVWPKTEGPKVFIYSENHAQMRTILRILTQLKWPVIAVAKHPARALMSQFQSESFSYSDELLNIEQIAKECDFAVTNANMATCMHFIGNGKPMILLPAHIEQTMFAERLEEKNCGIKLTKQMTPQEIKQKVLKIGEVEGTMHIQSKAFASEVQASLQINADEAMIKEVTSLLK